MSERPGRAQMLAAIRRHLHRGPLDDTARLLLRARLAAPQPIAPPARVRLDRPGLIDLFLNRLAREHATAARLADLASVPGAVCAYLVEAGLPLAAIMAPHPELLAAPWDRQPDLVLKQGVSDGSDPVGITQAWAAIAETGTLVLPSGPQRPTTLNLLPDTAIVLLRASTLLPTTEALWARMRAEGVAMPRSLMLVTGPSRSSDIEQTQELGAHGPRRVHVLLIDDEPP